jgi:hypothetical protein
MAMGTAFTIFFVPAIYLLVARDHRKEAEAREALPEGAAAEAHAAPEH